MSWPRVTPKLCALPRRRTWKAPTSERVVPSNSAPGTLVEAVRTQPSRPWSGRVWHHCPPHRRLRDAALIAATIGRFHRLGDPGLWYASTSQHAAWAELLRHHDFRVSPFEERRRIGRVRVDHLRILDLTDAAVRERLGVTEKVLVADDLALCQALGAAAQEAGFEGILTPSAAVRGAQTLVVFRRALSKLRVETERVQRPPVSIRNILPRLRLPAGAAARLRGALRVAAHRRPR